MLSRIERSIEHRSKGSVLAVLRGEDGVARELRRVGG
jgi:hypothetical protein